MDENNNNDQNTPTTESEGGGGGKWAWVVAAAVIVALIAFYAWPKKEVAEPAPLADTAADEVDAPTQSLENIGVSDEAADIEKDLNDTSLLDLDKEIRDIESEIGSQ